MTIGSRGWKGGPTGSSEIVKCDKFVKCVLVKCVKGVSSVCPVCVKCVSSVCQVCQVWKVFVKCVSSVHLNVSSVVQVSVKCV